MHKIFIVGLLAGILASCGGGGGTDSYGGDPKPPPDNDPAWANVAAIIGRDCAGCHNGTKEPLLTPAATFKASPAKAKLTGGKMPPPPKTIPDADKQALLAYLGG